jgi:hypothetical protein
MRLRQQGANMGVRVGIGAVTRSVHAAQRGGHPGGRRAADPGGRRTGGHPGGRHATGGRA